MRMCVCARVCVRMGNCRSDEAEQTITEDTPTHSSLHSSADLKNMWDEYQREHWILLKGT